MDPFAQAQEDLARERMMGHFRRILPYAALALALLLTAIAIREAYAYVSHRMDQNRSEALAEALNAADSVTALVQIAEKDDGARAALAGLIAFQRMDIEMQKTQGIALLENLAADKSLPEEWQHLAAVTLVRARIAFGGDKAADLLAALHPVIEDKDSPWQSSALLQAALIQGEMQQNREAAFQTLQSLQDNKMTPDLARKAATLRGRYAPAAKGTRS